MPSQSVSKLKRPRLGHPIVDQTPKGSQDDNNHADPEKNHSAWSFAASAYTYILSDSPDYVQPTVSADRVRLHLEARYNYENLHAGSAWLGVTFSGGKSVEWELTPISEDVVAWARSGNQFITSTANAICGVSLSGLAAAYTTLQYPSVFSRSLCQSGSFWWLADNEITWPQASAKMWLSVGNEETQKGVSHAPTGMFQRISQVDGVEQAVRQFVRFGATVNYNIHSGGHRGGPWRDELTQALRWLFEGDQHGAI